MRRWQVSENTQSGISGTLLKEERLPLPVDIMQCSVVTVGSDESVYKAIGILAEKKLSGLPVVDDGELVGIISEKDILQLLYETESPEGTVRDYMTADPVCFDINTPLQDIGRCLIENSFRRVALLRDNRLTGIISRADLIRYDAHRLMSPGQQALFDNRQGTPTADDAMKCGLLTAKRDTSLFDAATILATKHITGLPVVDDGMHLEGIISEMDILKRLFLPNVSGLVVEDLMTEDVTTFDKTDSLFDICDCLINNQFRRVPILDEDRLVGIISRTDIVLYILKNKSKVFGNRPMALA